MRLILLSFLFFFVSIAFANPGGNGGGNDSTNVFFKYSLDELLNKKITVASRGEETSNEAPAFTSNYSNNDIQYYGYYTLGDLANITSGYSKDHSLYGERGFETRGQRAGSFENDRHLILLDGIPMYFSRSNKAFTQYDMPLLGIENVSFLKGPGSALYGVSAFYGVLDLKTLSLEKNGFHTQSKLSYGSEDFEKRMMHSLNYKNDVGEFKIGLTLFDKLPSYDNVDSINGGNVGVRKNWDQNNSFFINSSYQANKGRFKGLSFGYLSSKRKTGIGEFWSDKNSLNNYIEWRTNVLYSKYNKKMTDKIQLNSYVFYNESIEEGGFQIFPLYSEFGGGNAFNNYKRTTANAQGSSELRVDYEKHDLILGFNVDTKFPLLADHSYSTYFNLGDTINPEPTFERKREGDKESITTFSLYAQEKFKVNLLEGLLITLGGRYDYGFSNTFNYDQISPRIALVQKVTEKLNIKLLAGSALRTPNIKIVGLNNEFNDLVKEKQRDIISTSCNCKFRANEDPKPEVIYSVDFGVNYRTKRLFLEGNMFYNIARDQIIRRSFTSYGDTSTTRDDLVSLNYVDNSDGYVNTLGYEVNMKFIPKKGIQVFGNHSYALAEDNTKIDDDKEDPSSFMFSYIPLAKTNIGVTTKLDKRGLYRVSSIYKLIHAYRIQESENTNGSFYSLDLNLILKPTSMLSFEVQLLDALNSESPSFSNNLLIPSRGRRLMLTIGFEF